MDLVKYEKLELLIPIKAIPETELNRIIIVELSVWLSDLISLTDEVSLKRLEASLPAIKIHCWSWGFPEIKKMFEMYADNQLSIKPIPNYFDRILFGKIVESYKLQRPIKKPIMKELSESEKDDIRTSNELTIYSGVFNCFEAYKQSNDIITGYIWVYDHLDELNILNYSDDIKTKQMPLAKQSLLKKSKERDTRSDYKSFLLNLENGTKKQAIINEAKNMLLCQFFSELIEEGKHIKEILK
jgi:hypothetical protein